MSFDQLLQQLKARGNFGHEGRPGHVGGSAPSDAYSQGGDWSGEGIESFTRRGDTYTKEDGQYTLQVKFSKRRAGGNTVGEKAVITVEDVLMKPGFAHEPMRLDSGYGGKKLNRGRVLQEAEKYLEQIKKGG